MSTNVVPLFKEEPPVIRGDISEIIGHITDWAELQGVDVTSVKYTYDCSTIATLLQIMAMGEQR